MTNLKLMAAAMLVALGATGPASADPLSPWEKFCVITQDPGKATGDCIDGLPSAGKPNDVAATPGKPRKGVQAAPGQQPQNGASPTSGAGHLVAVPRK